MSDNDEPEDRERYVVPKEIGESLFRLAGDADKYSRRYHRRIGKRTMAELDDLEKRVDNAINAIKKPLKCPACRSTDILVERFKMIKRVRCACWGCGRHWAFLENE